MRDLPMFTTQFGVASLTLKEIPYTQTAYILIQSASDPVAFLDECVGFCRAVGAEKIFASGTGIDGRYPLHTEILEMRVAKKDLPATCAKAKPIDEDVLESWRCHYNDRMKDVANAAWMDKTTALDILKHHGGYFIYKGDDTIGLGIVQNECLMAVAALRKGAGRDVVLALSEVIKDDSVVLEVASVNLPAVRLYQSLGFEMRSRKSVWYKIF